MNYSSFFSISYGMYIVATGNRETKNAYIANTVFQVSSEPARIAISAHKENSTTDLLLETGYFTVSVLHQQTNKALIQDLGYKQGNKDKFNGLSYFYTEHDVPVITEDSLAWFACKITGKIDVGSHWVIIGEALQAETLREDVPVLTYEYYRQVFKASSPEHAPTHISPEHLKQSEKPIEDQSDKQKPSYEPNPSKYKCLMCSYVYDPLKGDSLSEVGPGTSFDDLPDDWTCPVCGVGKDLFEEI